MKRNLRRIMQLLKKAFPEKRTDGKIPGILFFTTNEKGEALSMDETENYGPKDVWLHEMEKRMQEPDSDIWGIREIEFIKSPPPEAKAGV